jgi:hypothetical protein
LKVIVPVGAKGVLGVTVAVNVTDSPKTEDGTEGVTVVVLVAWTAVPVRATRCWVPGTSPLLSVTSKVAGRLPSAMGVKVTLIVQVMPEAMGDEATQLSVSA